MTGTTYFSAEDQREKILTELDRLRNQRDAAHFGIIQLAKEARLHRVTHFDIGAALGMTESGARLLIKRAGDDLTPPRDT